MSSTVQRRILPALAFALSMASGTVVAILGIPAAVVGVSRLSELFELDVWILLIGLQAVLVVLLGAAVFLHWFITVWMGSKASRDESEPAQDAPL
jgi:hypothetical protein